MDLPFNFSIYKTDANEKSVKDAIRNHLQNSSALPEMEIVIAEFDIYVSTDSEDLYTALEILSDDFEKQQGGPFWPPSLH